MLTLRQRLVAAATARGLHDYAAWLSSCKYDRPTMLARMRWFKEAA